VPLNDAARSAPLNGRTRLRLWAPLLIFACALAVRVALIFITGQYRQITSFEMERASSALAEHHSLADPYKVPTGPTAHVMPGYPIVLASLLTIFRSPAGGELAKQLVSCVVSSLSYALLPLAAMSFGLPGATGIAAGFAGALLPIRFRTETRGDWEAPWTALALILMACWTVSAWRQGSSSGKSAFLRGCGWGVAALFSAPLLTVFAGSVATGRKLQNRVPFRRYTVNCALSVLGVLLVLTPWIVRNWLVFGQPVLTRTNFGLELFVSNNDMAGVPDNLLALNRWHPLFNIDEALDVRRLGEPEYNRIKLQAALQWIRSHPARFADLTVKRFWQFWFYMDSWRQLNALAPMLITLTGLAGIWMARKTNRPAFIFCVTALGSYSLVYYFVQTMVRYRYPLDWIFLLFAAHAVLSIALSPSLSVAGWRPDR
jgi:hypothetical protein